MAQKQHIILPRPFMWKTTSLLLTLLHNETGTLQPFRSHVLCVAFFLPVETGLVCPPFQAGVAPLGLRAPIWEFTGLGKAGAKLLWPWDKIEAPAAIFYFIGQVKFLFQILCFSISLFQLDCVTSFSLKN